MRRTQGKKLKNIAFIDDDCRILDGIKRMLRRERTRWDMSFFESVDRFFEEHGKKTFDIVVSDIRMPKTNGVELLQKVKNLSPATIRIALSGFAQEELLLESLQVSHQFIAKPAESDEIIRAIDLSLSVEQLINVAGLKSAVGSIDSLPTLPVVYSKIMQVLATEGCTFREVGAIVAEDVALSTNVIRIVNSAYFGLRRHIESVEQAASILGMDTIKNLTLSGSVFKAFSNDKVDTRSIGALNHLALRRSRLMRKFTDAAQLSGRTKDHCQVAALMSVLGELICLAFPDALASKKTGSIEHPTIGAYALSIWGMPQAVVAAVMWQSDPGDSQYDEISPIAVLHAVVGMQLDYDSRGVTDEGNERINFDYLETVAGKQLVEQWMRLVNEDAEGE